MVDQVTSTTGPHEQFVLGCKHSQDKEYQQAAHWYRLSAEQGYDQGQHSLGRSYDLGEGVERDQKQAVHWFRLAAEQGLALAQYSLGCAYDLGRGVEQSHEEAVHWLRLAAEQGLGAAQMNLGYAYDLGEGVERDQEQAVHWYRLAAEQGLESAQYNLGVMYMAGTGVEANQEQAVHWLRLSAEKDFEPAVRNLEALGETPKGAELISFPGTPADIPQVSNIEKVFEDLWSRRRMDLKAEMRREIIKELSERSGGLELEVFDSNTQDLIVAGEGLHIEYKETFSFNTETKKLKDINIRYASLKEITGFLNTDGGVLLIGVSDSKIVTGIEADGYDGNHDRYLRTIHDLIKESLGVSAASFVEINISFVEEKRVCRISCRRSNHEVYCDYKNFGKRPFVRYGSSTVEPPHEEWLIHCRAKFK